MPRSQSKKATAKKAPAKKAAPKKERYYIAVSSVEILVSEHDGKGLGQRVEELASDLQIPLSEVGDSGMIKVFKGEEIPLKVKPPELSI